MTGPDISIKRRPERSRLGTPPRRRSKRRPNRRSSRTNPWAKVAGADKRITDPDLPTADDDKADVKKANDDEIASLKSDIAEGEKGIQLLDESGQTFAKQMQEQRAKNPIPPQNIELLKKHQAEFENIWGVKPDAR